MKEYYLFLDESKPNPNFRNFTLGGIAIEKSVFENELVPRIEQIKIDCFGCSNVVLHEIDIRKKEGDFEGITNKQQVDFFDRLRNVFKDDLFRVLAISINVDDLDNLYCEDERNDIYYIALQLLMENFVHFLSANDGVGSIFLEGTDPASNTKLQNLFYILKANGTLFIKKETLQNRLSTINFLLKNDNNVGLQVADFIPNSLARHVLCKNQKPYSIFDQICDRLYDGNIARKSRFGLKIIK